MSLSITLSLGSNLIICLFSCRNCGINDPSWAELRYFVNFLNSQLQACEDSSFCNMDLVGDTLEGFRSFVVRFMILMSRVRAAITLIFNSTQPLISPLSLSHFVVRQSITDSLYTSVHSFLTASPYALPCACIHPFSQHARLPANPSSILTYCKCEEHVTNLISNPTNQGDQK